MLLGVHTFLLKLKTLLWHFDETFSKTPEGLC